MNCKKHFPLLSSQDKAKEEMFSLQHTIWLLRVFLLALVLENVKGSSSSASNYLIGLGSYDITGPAADVNMMGYANAEQTASGIHFRLRARTFIVAEQQGNRVVFVNLDACMASQIVTIKLLERLKVRYRTLLVLDVSYFFKKFDSLLIEI